MSRVSAVLVIQKLCTYLFARSGSDLLLLDTAHLLHPVLAFLALLAAGSSLGAKILPGETVLGFDLLRVIECVVDQRKSDRFATCTRTAPMRHRLLLISPTYDNLNDYMTTYGWIRLL